MNPGNYDSIFFGCSNFNNITAADTLNMTGVTTMNSWFTSATNFNGNVSGINTTNVTDMSYMFFGINGIPTIFNQDIGNWNVSKVINMSQMFWYATSFNQNIGSWDVSGVYDANAMERMFKNATSFNQNLTRWNVLNIPTLPYGFADECPLLQKYYPLWGTTGAVLIELDNGITISYIKNTTPSNRFIFANPRGYGEWFYIADDSSKADINAYSYDQEKNSKPFKPNDQTDPVPFNNIVTTLMTDMEGLFDGATNFNSVISSWDTCNVTTMYCMFQNAEVFNRDISKWDTSSVESYGMSAMFNYAKSFNQDIGDWNTSKVTDMQQMFNWAQSFNQDIGSWTINTNAGVSMNAMFQGASSFNKDISGWDVSNVTTMSQMFYDAYSFNCNLNNWNINQLHKSNVCAIFYGTTSLDPNNINQWLNKFDKDTLFDE